MTVRGWVSFEHETESERRHRENVERQEQLDRDWYRKRERAEQCCHCAEPEFEGDGDVCWGGCDG